VLEPQRKVLSAGIPVRRDFRAVFHDSEPKLRAPSKYRDSAAAARSQKKSFPIANFHFPAIETDFPGKPSRRKSVYADKGKRKEFTSNAGSKGRIFFTFSTIS
jgi:hypothetical protein